MFESQKLKVLGSLLAFLFAGLLASGEGLARQSKARKKNKVRRIYGLKNERSRKPTQGRLKRRQPHSGMAHQILASVLDWDDNALHMSTNIYVLNINENKILAVSPERYAAIRADAEKGKKWRVDKKGDINSFRGFFDLENRHVFKEDVAKALKEKNFGPYANVLQHRLDVPLTARWTFVNTTRGHAGESLLDGILVWHKEGYIRHTMPKENLTGIDLPGRPIVYGRRMPKGLTNNQKKNFVNKARLDEIQAHPIGESAIDLVSANGRSKEKLHLFEFSDDDPGYVNSSIQFFKENVKRWPNVKIIVTYTGKQKRKGFEQTVITPNSNVREFGKNLKGSPIPSEKTEVKRSIESQQKAGIR